MTHLEVAERHELKRVRVQIHLRMSARTRSLHISTRVQPRTSTMHPLGLVSLHAADFVCL